MGLVGDLSSARLRDELIARCSRRARSSTRSCAWPSSAPTERSIRTSRPTTRRSSSARRALTALRDATASTIPSWRLGLAALARHLPPDEVYEWLQRLKVRRRDAERIAAAVHGRPAARRAPARKAPSRPTWSRSRSPTRPTRRSFALALADLPPLHAYFERLRDVQARRSSGADLAELGLTESPRVGRSSPSCAGRKLNGELDGRDSELARREGADRTVIRWDAPGPYVVGFTNRAGRRQRRRVRVAQPRRADRRRAGERRSRTAVAPAASGAGAEAAPRRWPGSTTAPR